MAAAVCSGDVDRVVLLVAWQGVGVWQGIGGFVGDSDGEREGKMRHCIGAGGG